jgi:hypothetical protein
MKSILLLATFLIPCGVLPAASITVTDAQLPRLRELVKSDAEAGAQFAKLSREAEAALKDAPNPIAKIQTEGKVGTDPARIQTEKSLADMKKINALGWGYAVTGDARYSTKAREFILAWAGLNVPTGDPIDETSLERLFEGYDLTRSQFAPADQALVQKWLRKIVQAETEHANAHKDTAINNWNSHRIKIIGLAGYVLGDAYIAQRAKDGYRKQIAQNLQADGSSLDFHERDALHYHCYDLEPLLALAVAARMNGFDLYKEVSPKGASLEKSVKFLVPYCTGEKQHAEYVNSKVAFDRKRADAGDASFAAGRPFAPSEGARTLELAAAFDSAFTPVYFTATGKSPSKYPSWQFVLNEVRKNGK